MVERREDGSWEGGQRSGWSVADMEGCGASSSLRYFVVVGIGNGGAVVEYAADVILRTREVGYCAKLVSSRKILQLLQERPSRPQQMQG